MKNKKWKIRCKPKILMKSKQRTGLVFTGGKEEELESC